MASKEDSDKVVAYVGVRWSFLSLEATVAGENMFERVSLSGPHVESWHLPWCSGEVWLGSPNVWYKEGQVVRGSLQVWAIGPSFFRVSSMGLGYFHLLCPSELGRWLSCIKLINRTGHDRAWVWWGSGKDFGLLTLPDPNCASSFISGLGLRLGPTIL